MTRGRGGGGIEKGTYFWKENLGRGQIIKLRIKLGEGLSNFGPTIKGYNNTSNNLGGGTEIRSIF